MEASKDSSEVVWLCVIGLLATLCFHSSINGGFVFDDVEAVVNNDDVKLSTPIMNIFGNDFWGTPVTHKSSHKSYRPLTVLSFRLNVVAASGLLVPSQFHMVNLVLYIMVCCSALLVLKRICMVNCTSQVPVIAAILFTVHPVHTEAVASVVGRADLLCALFMFCAFLVYSSNSPDNWHTMLAVALAAVAMFAKEQGITILGICWIYDILILFKLHPKMILHFYTRKFLKYKKIIFRHVILMFSTLFLLWVRWWIMDGTVPVFQQVDNPASFMDSVYFRVINYMYIYILNVWVLVCPEWLCFDWSMGCVPLIQSIGDVRTVLVLAIAFVLVAVIVSSLLASGSNSVGLKWMAVSLAVLPFLPASNVFFQVGFVIAERTMLVPSLGFCLAVALGVERLSEATPVCGRLIYGWLVLLTCIFCARSHIRTGQWSSEPALFWSALTVCPLNAKVHYNIAKTISNNTEAIKHYKEAIRLNPNYDQAMNNLANILKDVGKVSEAEVLLRRALNLRPDFPAAWMNLGIVLSNQKVYSEAEKCYKAAIQYRKVYPDCYYNLGNLYLELKDHSRAYDSWRQATTLDPTHLAAWSNIIIMLDSLGKYEEACSMGEKALFHLPNSSAIHFNIANAKGKINKFIEAEYHFKTAIQLKSDYPLYYVNLGVLYHHWKKYGLAKEMYQHALQLDPNLKSARKNLQLLGT